MILGLGTDPVISSPVNEFDLKTVKVTSPDLQTMHRLARLCMAMFTSVDFVSQLPLFEDN